LNISLNISDIYYLIFLLCTVFLVLQVANLAFCFWGPYLPLVFLKARSYTVICQLCQPVFNQRKISRGKYILRNFL
jgi:hypothetical protein